MPHFSHVPMGIDEERSQAVRQDMVTTSGQHAVASLNSCLRQGYRVPAAFQFDSLANCE